jgi:hypothetical protein
MSYFRIAEEDTVNATAGYGGQAAFPPSGPEDIESGAPFQNFVHLSTKTHLVTNVNVDTDLAPVLGRFSNEEEARDAKNVVLRGQFINVLLRLKGTKTASIEVHGMTYHKRVVRIVSISLYYEYCR